MHEKTATIWMPLQGEGQDVWVQVEAEVVGDSTFRVLGPEPDGQAWAYAPNTVVRCVPKLLIDRRTRGLFVVEELPDED
jgi:hypothetical protein